MWIWNVLRHPLFVTAIGLGVTSLIVPYWTRRWQNNQKALELKTGLVTDITEQTVDFIRSIDAVLSIRAQSSLEQWRDEDSAAGKQYLAAFQNMNRGYHTYEVARAVTAEKLRVYFPHTDLASRWESLSELLIDVYKPQGTAPSDYYTGQLQQTAKKFSISGRNKHPPDWIEIRAAFLTRKTSLVKELLASDIVALSSLRITSVMPVSRPAGVGRRSK